MNQQLQPERDPELSILCVDDEENVLKSLRRVFQHEHIQVLTATSGRQGLEILQRTDTIGLILSDQRMPEMSGTAFLHEASLLRPDVPRMILTGYADMNATIDAINQGGAFRFLTKPWQEHELLQAVRDGLQRYRLIRENQRLTEVVRQQNEELAEHNASMRKRVLQQTAQLREQLELQESRVRKIQESVVRSFSEILMLRHQRMVKHSRTVSLLADKMAEVLGVGYHLRETIRVAGLLHDIGCIGLPDRVLAKSRELLTSDEIEEYRTHSIRGQMIVGAIEELRDVGLFIRHHHETYDGRGYPDGLAGDDIPLGARIISLANWIENTFSQEGGADAKYRVARKMTGYLGRSFDPALSQAANQAITQILQAPPVIKDNSEEEVALDDLRPGMILSRSIHSLTGILILHRSTPLDDDDISALRRYYGEGHLTGKVHVLQRSITASPQ